MNGQDRLKRSITLPLLIAYGVGTMVGGGFYALLGRVARHAGMQMPIAILVSATVALITALSFSELASRLPFSAGESRYVNEAFGRKWLSQLIGWGVIATGVVSSATLTRAFVNFWQDLFHIPTMVGVIVFVLLLTGVAVRGIVESVWLAAIITAIEVGGLIWVSVVNMSQLPKVADHLPEILPQGTWDSWSGIGVGAFVAFYAFIGFEDMVNEAEEVEQPRRNLPRGILSALLITSGLYLLIGTIAVVTVSPQELAASNTPLALLVSKQGEVARVTMTFISMLAGINGALVQVIMASRVAYGMADQGIAPRLLAVVHTTRRTPVNATLVVAAIVLILALWLPVESLAKVTSGIMLLNFTLVNASLVQLKRQPTELPAEIVQYPIWVPIVGCVVCLVFLLVQILIAPV